MHDSASWRRRAHTTTSSFGQLQGVFVVRFRTALGFRRTQDLRILRGGGGGSFFGGGLLEGLAVTVISHRSDMDMTLHPLYTLEGGSLGDHTL